MEYHANRFIDHSLLAYENGRLVAVLPANVSIDTLHSHQGLTFGGWVMGSPMTTDDMRALFEALRKYLISRGIKNLAYKCIPSHYHRAPAGADTEFLQQQTSAVLQSGMTMAIDMRQRAAFSGRRRRGIRKAKKLSVFIEKSNDFAAFHTMLKALLQKKYNAIPTHDLQELLLLRSRFPQNIHLYCAIKEEQMVAGVVIFDFATVARVQYVASTEEGRKSGAIDLLFESLITEYFASKYYFDLSTSYNSVKGGANPSLAAYKEELGGRPFVVNTYQIAIEARDAYA